MSRKVLSTSFYGALCLLLGQLTHCSDGDQSQGKRTEEPGTGGSSTGPTGGGAGASGSARGGTSAGTAAGEGGDEAGGAGASGRGGSAGKAGSSAGGAAGDGAAGDGAAGDSAAGDGAGGAGDTTCHDQSDCSATPDSYCAPTTLDSVMGVCAPKSSSHCASCTNSTQCGTHSELCTAVAGDPARSCHIDCSLAGADACPPEYTCERVTTGGAARRLCMPDTPTCGDAYGGYCDRSASPIPCTRENEGGRCTGERTCLIAFSRYSTCGAEVPECRATCDIENPAGCELEYCPGVLSVPENCGSCGRRCPGIGVTSAMVACDEPPTCSLVCAGERYDVDGSPDNGCEVEDPRVGQYTEAAPYALTDRGCGSSSTRTGILPSDRREHVPPIPGFDATTGSAAKWYKFRAGGAFPCARGLNAYLLVNTSVDPTCYGFRVITDRQTLSCRITAGNRCDVSASMNAYTSDRDVFLVVERLCDTSAPSDSASYELGYGIF